MSSLHSQQVPRGAPRDTGLPSCSPHNARNGRRVSPGSTLARTLKCGLKFLMGLVGLRKTSVDSPASGWRRVLAGMRRFLPLPRPAPESRLQTRPGQGWASEEVTGCASSREACGSGRVWRVPAASRSHWVAGQSGHNAASAITYSGDVPPPSLPKVWFKEKWPRRAHADFAKLGVLFRSVKPLPTGRDNPIDSWNVLAVCLVFRVCRL